MEENAKDKVDIKIPDDLILVKLLQSSIEFHLSKSTNRLFMNFTDYHQGPVEINRVQLLELVNIMDKSQEEKESELLKELENNEDDFL